MWYIRGSIRPLVTVEYLVLFKLKYYILEESGLVSISYKQKFEFIL